MSEKNPKTVKVVLITGASVGFGYATADLLTRQGHRVFGTSRKPSEGTDWTMLQLDVNSDESVEKCVRTVLEQAGRIDVLVNNAGYLLHGPIEECTIDQAKDLFETNFFGVARMVRAVLPSMRQNRSGKIINVGSLAGLVASPGHGFYAASKFALEGYTEALAYELADFNIRCVLVEPGHFKTELSQSMITGAEPISTYDAIRTHLEELFIQRTQTGPDPAIVARLIASIVRSPAPRLRYPVGRGSRTIALLRRILPNRLFAWGTRKYYHLD